MASLGELQRLHQDLHTAMAGDQFHRLLEFDQRIRAVIEDLMLQVKQQPQYAPVLYKALQALLATYQDVVQRCTDVSEQLKQELNTLQTQRHQTLTYLSVARQGR